MFAVNVKPSFNRLVADIAQVSDLHPFNIVYSNFLGGISRLCNLFIIVLFFSDCDLFPGFDSFGQRIILFLLDDDNSGFGVRIARL